MPRHGDFSLFWDLSDCQIRRFPQVLPVFWLGFGNPSQQFLNFQTRSTESQPKVDNKRSLLGKPVIY